ncbi:tRNA epoxyqueuosine(34) reductase QueG [Thiomicrorhabdus sp. 6S3-12]|uniref:tRNA epoxyqueuosine(34) reductase QueG n=1 Tax=Thiomicrorhabdus sp. 6S3-12 TaxID=2819681 RepID=UPI001AAD00BF|nr:tRNA epoxyqueuosine(34) reductase QueG [Thiomicrorhabdus sp. 6S3-12]MBO1924261.1 tRNA epoxyqueuosine(34) reductase QueG [Thiomicrorhabdus sp. 6S3-12]
MNNLTAYDPEQLARKIKTWGTELGFADVGITDCDLSAYEGGYFSWLDKHFHGEMDYMQAHGTKRTRPQELVPGTLRLISVRMNYFDGTAANALQQLHAPERAYISRYALGKDYHKLLRKRLQQLAEKIRLQVPDLQFRAFTDSAPVLEQAIAEKSGLGFIGKNSLIIHPRAGSWFFLGELYVNLPLPVDAPFEKQGCGPCDACIRECPTQAIIDNNQVDAQRCISYLTIEYDGVIDESLRPLIGNRIYGCDDCQLVCPWNRFSTFTDEAAFAHRAPLDNSELLPLFSWSEAQFLKHFEGSPIRRIGYAKWTRNLAIALGNLVQTHHNAVSTQVLQNAQQAVDGKIGLLNETVDIHLRWASERLRIGLQQRLAEKQPLESIAVELKPAEDIRPFKVRKYHYPQNRKSN